MVPTPGDGGSQPEPPPESADTSSDVACKALATTIQPSVAVATRDLDGRPWLAGGRDVNTQQEAVVIAIDDRRLSLVLMPTSHVLQIDGVDTSALSTAVGDSVWVRAQSNGGGNFQPFASLVVVRESVEGPVLLASYEGDQRLLEGAFGAALGIAIDVADACSYVADNTCFDDQPTTVIELTLSADDQLTLTSGGSGELSIGGDGYGVVVGEALRWGTGSSARCADTIFGPSFKLALSRR